MHKRNNGSTEQEILQNRFTAYMTTCIHRERIAYLEAKTHRDRHVYEMEEEHLQLIPDDTDIAIDYGSSEWITGVLDLLTEKERYILVGRVFAGKGFDEIAEELGMKYNATAMTYYRTIAKLRELLGGKK